MSASARATPRRWVLLSLQGAELLGALAVAVAARWPLLLLQPAATNPSTATASARVPVAGGRSPAAGMRNRGILTEPSGGRARCLHALRGNLAVHGSGKVVWDQIGRSEALRLG